MLIIFGLHTMGVLQDRRLYWRSAVQTNTKPASLLGAMLVGIAFAFGWTPCIGPILAAILAVAARAGDRSARASCCWRSTRSASAIPFLLTSLAINQFFVAFAQIRRHYHTIEIVSGL